MLSRMGARHGSIKFFDINPGKFRNQRCGIIIYPRIMHCLKAVGPSPANPPRTHGGCRRAVENIPSRLQRMSLLPLDIRCGIRIETTIVARTFQDAMIHARNWLNLGLFAEELNVRRFTWREYVANVQAHLDSIQERGLTTGTDPATVGTLFRDAFIELHRAMGWSFENRTFRRSDEMPAGWLPPQPRRNARAANEPIPARTFELWLQDARNQRLYFQHNRTEFRCNRCVPSREYGSSLERAGTRFRLRCSMRHEVSVGVLRVMFLEHGTAHPASIPTQCQIWIDEDPANAQTLLQREEQQVDTSLDTIRRRMRRRSPSYDAEDDASGGSDSTSSESASIAPVDEVHSDSAASQTGAAGPTEDEDVPSNDRAETPLPQPPAAIDIYGRRSLVDLPEVQRLGANHTEWIRRIENDIVDEKYSCFYRICTFSPLMSNIVQRRIGCTWPRSQPLFTSHSPDLSSREFPLLPPKRSSCRIALLASTTNRPLSIRRTLKVMGIASIMP